MSRIWGLAAWAWVAAVLALYLWQFRAVLGMFR